MLRNLNPETSVVCRELRSTVTEFLQRDKSETEVQVSYKIQISVKHNNFVIQLDLRQHVSTVLSHHQAF